MAVVSYQAVLNSGIVNVICGQQTSTNYIVPMSNPCDNFGNAYSVTNPQPVASQGVTRTMSATPTVTAATYALSKVMGGIMTFASLLPAVSPFGATLGSITLKFKGSVQTVGFWVALFTGSPTGTFTDTNTAAIAAADSALLIGLYHLTGPTSVLGTHTDLTLSNIRQGINGTSANIYAVVVPDSTTATLGSTSDMTLTLGVTWG